MQTQQTRALGRITSTHWKSGLTALFLGVALTAGAPLVLAAPDVPLVAEAYNQASRPLLGKSVQATVTLTLLDKIPTQPGVIAAQGKVRLEGDLLEGTLPMTFNEPGKAKAGTHNLRFNVNRQGRIGLQWLLNAKPLDGAAMKAFDTQATSDSLSSKVKWNGATRLVTITFGYGSSPLQIAPIRVTQVAPIRLRLTPTPKPLITGRPIIIKVPKKPIGRRVRVTGRFVVTNSDDGVSGIWGSSDKSVELQGNINLGDQPAFSFINRSARAGSEFDSKGMNSVMLRYDDPNRHFFPVKGNVWDRDKASASDTLFNASQKIDLLKILESNSEYLIKGDRNSESADLYIRVTDEGEVF